VVAVEAVTGFPFARPVPLATAYEAARFLVEEVFTLIGMPSVLLSDHGSHFKNNLLASVTRIYGVG